MKQSTKTTNRAFIHNNIPYKYCYEEGGMIEIEKHFYTGSYEIMLPNKEKKGSYNSKMTKMIMEEILQKLAEKFSFQFTIRNRYRDKEEYLASVMIDEKGAGDAYGHLKNLYNNVLQENCDIGHIEPRIIESARRKAKEQEKKRKAKEAMEAAKALEEMTVKPGDETKTKEQLQKDLESREKLPKEESSEVLAKYKISQMQILDSYSPMYEFEE